MFLCEIRTDSLQFRSKVLPPKLPAAQHANILYANVVEAPNRLGGNDLAPADEIDVSRSSAILDAVSPEFVGLPNHFYGELNLSWIRSGLGQQTGTAIHCAVAV